jgi:hypothetical protein
VSELLAEIVVRLAKLVIAALIGAVMYWFLVGPLGVPGSAQLALEAWIAGALAVSLVQTGAV